MTQSELVQLFQPHTQDLEWFLARRLGCPALHGGNRLFNVPRHAGNLWTTYEFQEGMLQGFGEGAGFFAAGKRTGDLANSFELPGVRADRRRAQSGLALRYSSVVPAAPLTVLGFNGVLTDKSKRAVRRLTETDRETEQKTHGGRLEY